MGVKIIVLSNIPGATLESGQLQSFDFASWQIIGGNHDLSSNHRMAGKCTMTFTGGESSFNIAPSLPSDDLQLNFAYQLGTHMLEFSGGTTTNAIPDIRITVSGNRYNIASLTLSTSIADLILQQVTVNGYGRCILPKSTSLSFKDLTIESNARVQSDDGTIDAEFLQWQGGQIGPGLVVNARKSLKVLESSTTLILDNSKVVSKEMTWINRKSSCQLIGGYVELQGQTYFESDALFSQQNTAKQNEVILSGDTTFINPNASVKIQTKTTLTGNIAMNEGSLTVQEAFSNATFQGSSAVLAVSGNGLESVLAKQGKLDIKDGLLKVLGGNLILSSDYDLEKFHGYNGEMTIPEDVTVEIDQLLVLSGFTLTVNGKINCNRFTFHGGTLTGVGLIKAKSFYWKTGTLSVGNVETSGNGLEITREAKIYSGERKDLSGNLLTAKDSVMKLEQDVEINLSNGGYFKNEGSMNVWQNAKINGDDESKLENNGDIVMHCGSLPGNSRISVPKVLTGTLKINRGICEIGKESELVGQVSVDKKAALRFNHGIHKVLNNGTLEARGLVSITGSTTGPTTVVIDESSGSLELNMLTLDAGQLILNKPIKNKIATVKLHGGTLTPNKPIKIREIQLFAGILEVNTKINAESILIFAGKISTQKRQNKLTCQKMIMKGGTLECPEKKKLTIDIMDLTVTGNLAKVITGSVQLTCLKTSRIVTGNPLVLADGATVINPSDGIMNILAGSVSGTGLNSKLINNGLMSIGHSEKAKTDVNFGVCIENNGKIEGAYTHIILECGGSFFGQGIHLDEASVIKISGGEMQATPDTFPNRYQKIDIKGGTLTLLNGTYPNILDITLSNNGQLHVPGLQNLQRPTSSGSLTQLTQVELNGDVFINGGLMNISGSLTSTSRLRLLKGAIGGSGQMEVASPGSISISYGNSPEDSRDIGISELFINTEASVKAPLTLTVGGLYKQAVGRSLELIEYGSLHGEGTLINAGLIKVTTNPNYLSRITTNLENFWEIIVEAHSKLAIGTSSSRKLKCNDGSSIEGTDYNVWLYSNIYLGGSLEGEQIIDGDISFYIPTFITGTVNWKCGSFQFHSDVCSFDYNPPSRSPISQPCEEPYILIEGAMVINDDKCTSRRLNRKGILINKGLIDWSKGKVLMYKSSLINLPNGKLMIHGDSPHELGHESNHYQDEIIDNSGYISINHTSVLFKCKILNKGSILVNGSKAVIDYLKQETTNAVLNITALSSLSVTWLSLTKGEMKGTGDLEGDLYIHGDVLDWNGKHKGRLIIHGGTITLRGLGFNITYKFIPSEKERISLLRLTRCPEGHRLRFQSKNRPC